MPLTEANYNVALKLLEERFGNTQQIISMHMDDLLQLPTCSGTKPAELRLILDKVSVNVRGLESLGVKSEQYGSSLIPIIMSKLPADVRLQIARVTTKDVWHLPLLVPFLLKTTYVVFIVKKTISHHHARRLRIPKPIRTV